jgi:glucose-6-phosphate isomerase
VRLALYHDKPESQSLYEEMKSKSLLDGLKALDAKIRRKGFESLDPSKSTLVSIGTESKGDRVTKNSYGVFNLAWQSEEHPEWAEQIESEVREIRARIRSVHGVPLQFLIWAGMGGSAEDKTMYAACGLLKGSPHCYVLDSTDPAKLNAILADMERRGKRPVRELLKRTLVVGMAMGMTSYEPVVNLQRIAQMYDNCGLDATPNFIYLTLPDSLLDQFAGPRGFRKVELQLDNGNSTAGRHSGPLTRGSLYPLALAGVDLKTWFQGTHLTEEEIDTAFRLAAFLHAQGKQGRDKLTLLLTKSWSPAALWTKQDFEESLGKSDEIGIKVIIDEKPRLAYYRSPKDGAQDRVFLSVQRQGERSSEFEKTVLIRRAGYPTAVLTIGKDRPLSTYMQFMHYVVFGLGYLRKMNFVTQPSVELYKGITNKLFGKAATAKKLDDAPSENHTADYRGRVTLRYERLNGGTTVSGKTAPEIYARLLWQRFAAAKASYGELTFFGDLRYDRRGQSIKRMLTRAGDAIFRRELQAPVDVYEGPAMNHSYHEMIIGHGHCFSTVMISDAPESVRGIEDGDLYHRCQFLATQMALEQRGRDVVSIHLRDLSPKSIEAAASFFNEAGRHLRSLRRNRA